MRPWSIESQGGHSAGPADAILCIPRRRTFLLLGNHLTTSLQTLTSGKHVARTAPSEPQACGRSADCPHGDQSSSGPDT